jgi:hypothetical protein
MSETRAEWFTFIREHRALEFCEHGRELSEWCGICDDIDGDDDDGERVAA